MRDFKENEDVRKDKTLIKRFYGYLQPHIKTFILSFILMIIGTFTGTILPLASGLAIDQMTNPLLSLSTKIWIIVIGSIVLIITSGLSMIVNYYQNIMLQRVGQKITHTIRHQVFNHISTLSIGQLNQLPVGSLVTRTTNDPANISDMFTNTIVNLVRSVLTMMIILVILLVISPFMTLVTVSVIPFILLATHIYRQLARDAYRSMRTKVSQMNAYLSEHISGMKIIQVFHQEKKKQAGFQVVNTEVKTSSIKEMLTFSIYRPVLYFLSMLATLLAIYVGITSIFEGILTVGLFVSFYVYVGQLFEPIQQMSEQLNTIQGSFASAEKIFDVLDTKPDIVDAIDAIELTSFQGKVEFKDVWFSYIPDEWVLKGVSFTVNPHDTIAFVGATGSGKTTILQLIVRNYQVQKGQILIDGIPIETITRASLRKHIGQMLQDVFLFSGTIEENITLRNETMTEEAILKASEYVGLDYVLKKQPLGLKQEVKERGKNFSAGERQLISFARAVVYQPTLMILDEATSNIDSETEAIIQTSLKKMMDVSTMLIVAHRLSTIQHSNRIIVMSKGSIVESGTHQALLNQKGLYYNLYLLQEDEEKSSL